MVVSAPPSVLCPHAGSEPELVSKMRIPFVAASWTPVSVKEQVSVRVQVRASVVIGPAKVNSPTRNT
jgi:hypothetical protein